ncbi:hypothetical protein BT96DRAFT_798685, partial [Gymnopus androsaceus JB14]
ANCIWLFEDCKDLCIFLLPHVAAAGETKKFKAAVIKSASAHLNGHIHVGGLKKESGVRKKIADIFSTYSAVNFLKHEGSGLSWSDVDGSGVHTDHEESVWAGIIANRPN